MYRVYYLVTYGDSTSSKWVASYKLDGTIDSLNWKTLYWVRKNDIELTIISQYIYLFYRIYLHLINRDVSLTLHNCRTVKEIKMLRIMQPGGCVMLAEQEVYDSLH